MNKTTTFLDLTMSQDVDRSNIIQSSMVSCKLFVFSPVAHTNHTLHWLGTPCDHQGNDLPPNTAPPPWDHLPPHEWVPFKSRPQFEFADFLYCKAQLSAGKIDKPTDILAVMYGEQDPSFRSHREMYQSINSISLGDAPWHSFSVKYAGPLPDNPPTWMTAEYDIHMAP